MVLSPRNFFTYELINLNTGPNVYIIQHIQIQLNTPTNYVASGIRGWPSLGLTAPFGVEAMVDNVFMIFSDGCPCVLTSSSMIFILRFVHS